MDRVLAVCSDYTVGGGGVRAADWPVPVTTDAEVIAKWLADAPGGRWWWAPMIRRTGWRRGCGGPGRSPS